MPQSKWQIDKDRFIWRRTDSGKYVFPARIWNPASPESLRDAEELVSEANRRMPSKEEIAVTLMYRAPNVVGTYHTALVLADAVLALIEKKQQTEDLAETTYYVKTTYVNAQGESLPSPKASLTADNGLKRSDPACGPTDFVALGGEVAKTRSSDPLPNADAPPVVATSVEPSPLGASQDDERCAYLTLGVRCNAPRGHHPMRVTVEVPSSIEHDFVAAKDAPEAEADSVRENQCPDCNDAAISDPAEKHSYHCIAGLGTTCPSCFLCACERKNCSNPCRCEEIGFDRTAAHCEDQCDRTGDRPLCMRCGSIVHTEDACPLGPLKKPELTVLEKTTIEAIIAAAAERNSGR